MVNQVLTRDVGGELTLALRRRLAEHPADPAQDERGFFFFECVSIDEGDRG